MRISSVFFIGLAVVGCSEAWDPSVDSTERPIVAGTLDTGDPAVMELLAFKGNSGARCTATLVTSRVLLTAAHCFVETAGFTYSLFAGNDDNNGSPQTTLPVKTTVFNPLYGNPRQGNDFAIIVLQAPLGIRPVPINRAPLDAAQGKDVRYIGYGLSNGLTGAGGGVKRQNTAPLAGVSGLLLALAPSAHGACNGDSGGPLLIDDGHGERIAGVGSFVDDSTCRRDSFYQRVDTQLAWVDQQIEKYDPGGLAPPADGGAGDTSPAGAPDTGAPDTTPPGSGQDARAPEPDSMPPRTEPARDARARDVARAADVEPATDPGPDQTNLTSGSTGGCALAARSQGCAGSAAVLLALAWLRRRRR
jgi:hypothetical protein